VQSKKRLYISTVRMRDMKNPTMKAPKVKFQIEGETYELPLKAIRNWGGKETLYISHAEASLLVRQFCKKFFPQYVVKVNSQSYSGGNSLDVYVCTKTGGGIPHSAFEKISSFAHLWEYGKFNGMYDIYEHYEESGTMSDSGREIKAGVKYVFVNNRPKFGTVEAILNEVLNEGRTFEEVTRFYTDKSGRVAAMKAKLMLDRLTK
jgi:hypothetical protein